MVGVTRPAGGDMLKATYDPNFDGKIAAGEIEDDYIEEKDILRDTAEKDTPSDTFATDTTVCLYIDGTVTKLAVKITPTSEWIKSFKFKLRHQGANLSHTPIYARIHKTSDLSVLDSKTIGYRDDEVSGTIKFYTVVFDTPVYVNEEIYASVETFAGSADDQVGPMGVSAGGAGNAYKYISGWTQIGAGYDMYFVLDYYAQFKCLKVV